MNELEFFANCVKILEPTKFLIYRDRIDMKWDTINLGAVINYRLEDAYVTGSYFNRTERGVIRHVIESPIVFLNDMNVVIKRKFEDENTSKVDNNI